MHKGVFIIAELSANHGHDIEIAKETIRAAKRAGADAIKLQTYTADTITLNSDKEDFIIKGTIWDQQKLYDLYQEAYLPWEWHAELFALAKELDLVCFSSPFDFSAVDLLESLDCPIYKIASFEITDIPLISYVASKGKPMILSTGIAEYEDIKLAIETIRAQGVQNITLLKCTSSYPAPLEEANMAMLQKFKADFNVEIGLSDHTMGSIVPIVATALGARVIEKHFILDKKIGGPDASFSMDEGEFKDMVQAVRQAESAVGEVSYALTEKQQSGKAFSRSLYIAEDVMAGELITNKNVRSVRPGFGMHPKFLAEILGKKFKDSYTKGTALTTAHISK